MQRVESMHVLPDVLHSFTPQIELLLRPVDSNEFAIGGHIPGDQITVAEVSFLFSGGWDGALMWACRP